MNEGIFECTWDENPDITEPTIIFIPNLNRLIEENVWIDPESDKIILESIPSSNAGCLLINPAGQSLKRKLKIILVK